ncbi:hypothetical protein BX260_3642 [Streptomyces sp. 5112.2]|nr:hypothetical protein BX260_3642 [Streptomyces sp. 5112.2]
MAAAVAEQVAVAGGRSRRRSAGPEGSEPIVGEVTGFLLTSADLPGVYISGDNASLDLVGEIAARYAPVDTAVLFAGAPRLPVLDDASSSSTAPVRRRPPGFSVPAGWWPPTATAGPISRSPGRTSSGRSRRRA